MDQIKDTKNTDELWAENITMNEALKKEMNEKGLQVDKVTIGKGYNDVLNLLHKNFSNVDETTSLNDYTGYSDAKKQVEINRKR